MYRRKLYSKLRSLIFFCFTVLSLGINAQILVDATFDDWSDENTVIDDAGDNTTVDIQKLWIANDENFLFIRLDLDQDIDILDDPNITIWIDTDNNPGTGVKGFDIGADIIYSFGSGRGTVVVNGREYSVSHDDISLFSLPTVTSSQFEIAFRRNSVFGNGSLEMQRQISIVAINNIQNGDYAPNENGGLIYQMVDDPLTAEDDFSYDRPERSEFRLMSYNVERDGLFDPITGGYQDEIIRAVNPDIIAFQEIYNNSPESVLQVLQFILPRPEEWYYAFIRPDIMVFSRYEIIASNPVDGNGAFLIQMDTHQQLLLYNVHYPCCENDRERELEIDKLMASIRDKSRIPNIAPLIQENTPIIITGDMNLVGVKEDIESMITGNIRNEVIYGEDFKPDMDGSDLEEAYTKTAGFPANFTWYNPGSSYSPGRLDLILYSGSVMKLKNSYALSTENMGEMTRNELGISSNSTSTLASDHLAVVADFTFDIDEDNDSYAYYEECDDLNPDINPDAEEITDNGIDENCDGMDATTGIDDIVENTIIIYPNPGSDFIYFQRDNSDPIFISIYDITGKDIFTTTLTNNQVNVGHLNRGMYLIKMGDQLIKWVKE